MCIVFFCLLADNVHYCLCVMAIGLFSGVSGVYIFMAYFIHFTRMRSRNGEILSGLPSFGLISVSYW